VRALFDCGVKDGVIWVEDLDQGAMSVTNDAEAVVEHVTRRFGMLPVVYQDSTGLWDGLGHCRGTFTEFIGLNCSGLQEAVDAMRRRIGK
jgi:hypothetical protein